MGFPFVSLSLFRGFLLPLLLHPFWAAAAGARLECQIAFVISASAQEESSDCFMLGWTLVHVSFSLCYKISEVGLGTGALEISLFPFSFVFDTMIFFPCRICENCSCGFFFLSSFHSEGLAQLGNGQFGQYTTTSTSYDATRPLPCKSMIVMCLEAPEQ